MYLNQNAIYHFYLFHNVLYKLEVIDLNSVKCFIAIPLSMQYSNILAGIIVFNELHILSTFELKYWIVTIHLASPVVSVIMVF